LSIFGCRGNAICFIENSDSILLFADSKKTYYSQLKFLDFLHRTLNNANVVDVYLHLVAMVTLFDPLKISNNIREFADS